jgi:hypothetical protein
MRMSTHRVVVSCVTELDVLDAVVSLVEPGEAFVVLDDDRDDETYVQAAGSLAEGGFVVERRDGSAGEHHRGDRRLSSEELSVALLGYLRGDPDWSHVCSWHRVRVDRDPVRC